MLGSIADGHVREFVRIKNAPWHSGIMSCLPAIKLSGKPGATDDKKL